MKQHLNDFLDEESDYTFAKKAGRFVKKVGIAHNLFFQSSI